GHFAVGRESALRDDRLPTDMLNPEFLGGIEIRIPDFEAVADRPNEWRLAPPETLVKLIPRVLDAPPWQKLPKLQNPETPRAARQTRALLGAPQNSTFLAAELQGRVAQTFVAARGAPSPPNPSPARGEGSRVD